VLGNDCHDGDDRFDVVAAMMAVAFGGAVASSVTENSLRLVAKFRLQFTMAHLLRDFARGLFQW
jgi:hypothetical protein